MGETKREDTYDLKKSFEVLRDMMAEAEINVSATLMAAVDHIDSAA